MKIAIVQTKPLTGDIESNIADHANWISTAIKNKCNLIIFPELSLTGYEPQLADKLAIYGKDKRLCIFQDLSDEGKLTICAGSPTKTVKGTHISMLLFQPGKKMKIYSKKYLHPDEFPFFKSGENLAPLAINKIKTAFAICYELSVEEHIKKAVENNAEIYLASVAKFENNVDHALKRLSQTAWENQWIVCMANSVGPADGWECAGKSSVWDSTGVLKGQLDNKDEGILIYDTLKGTITT